ncbi:MAG TPA: hypothetical protein VJ810_08570 [Blastocatellia bacterium]|nr:hypothetical protein [Blastocatellia bacterium]
MTKRAHLLLALVSVLSAGTLRPASAQQTSIIPITGATNSNGAFVRGASNDGKRIVFESTNDYTGENKDGNNEIFVYDSDLRKIIQITRTGSQSGSSGSGGGVTLNGSGPQSNKCPGGCEPAQFAATNAVPAISGDGTRIVFASSSGLLTGVANADGNGEIYLATLTRGATTATIERLTETDGLKDSFDNNTPAINYDGSVIAFVSTRRFFKSRGVQIFTAQNEDGNAQIYVYEVNSRRFTQVTHKRIDEGIVDFDVKGFISNPFLSGDGGTLAFLSGFNFGGTPSNPDLNGEIFIYKVGDPINQVRQVTNTTETADVPADGAVNTLSRFGKHLSDDGSLLVFESAGGASPVKTGERIRDVFIYNVNTKAFTQVTTQDVGKRDLSDFNYFPSINGAGTYVTFSSKLNLPVINDSAGNFNNSREIFRYDIAASTPSSPRFFLATQTRLSTTTPDQRLILFAPFVNDGGDLIAFSNNGDLIAEKFNGAAEVFQAALRPVIRQSAGAPRLANAASFDTTAVARGSSVAAFGVELANETAASEEVDNYPFELNGVSVTVGDSLSGIAGRLIFVSQGQVNFVMPPGVAADDDVAFTINNNGVISQGVVNVRDAAPGIYAASGLGGGEADAKCASTSVDGKAVQFTKMPCVVGYDASLNSISLLGTGVRFGTDIRIRFRFQLGNGEEDEIEVTPNYADKYVDENGREHMGVDQIIVTLDEELAGRVNVETMALLTSNSESMTSQEQILTSFAGFDEDMIVINAASHEAGPIARGSIASARPQNDDDEEDVFTDQTITASNTNPPLELAGVRVKVAGIDARILSVSPEDVRFIVPDGVEAADNALVQLTNGVKVFNSRMPVKDAAPGLFTQTDDGDGPVKARCGLVLGSGVVEYSAPPCAVSSESEKRILVLTGSGWRFASGVKVTFSGVEIIPTYAGPEPGLPGVDRIELELTGDVATDVAGREEDIVVNATINGENTSSQSGATIAFKDLLNDTDPQLGNPPRNNKIPAAGDRRNAPALHINRKRNLN